ncbi:MAG: tetratricopeptide repeat protein [Deltaproteobacteria bacterium]|nr:tetratricopeptide repeat protein [Deltaproteobacteria bacterium]
MSRSLVLFSLLSSLACKDAPPAPPKKSDAEQRIDALPAQVRTLCLAPAPGDGPVDRMLKEAAKDARRVPQKLDPWVLLGQAWMRKARESKDEGYYLHADACAEAGLLAQPGAPLASSIRAAVLASQHKFGEAKSLAESILTRDPETLMALGVLSDAALELGEIEAAERAAQRMVDAKPDLPSYARVSYLRFLRGDLAGAKAIMGSAFKAGRGQADREPPAWALVEAATYFWHAGDYDGAEAGYLMALDYAPLFAPALVGRGRVALSRGRAVEAVGHLRAAQATHEDAELLWLLGDALLASGDDAAAREVYAKLEVFARRSDKRTLAWFWAASQQHTDEALALASEEANRRPGVYTLAVLAFAQARAGQRDAAAETAQRMLRFGTKDARLSFIAGLAEKDPKAARRHFEAALKLNPGFDFRGRREAAERLGRVK